MALRNQEIAERIVALRKAKHLPQSAVYEALNMSERGYQNWESGKSKPNYRSLQKLAEFFGVSEGYILEGVDDRPVIEGVPEQLDTVDEKFTELVNGVRVQLNLIEAKIDALTGRVDRLLHMVDHGLFTPREDGGSRDGQVGLGAALAAVIEANPDALGVLAQHAQAAQAHPQRTAGKRSRRAG